MIEYKGKELWTYFFNQPKNYYNKYMFEMINHPEYLYFDNEEIISYKGRWNEVFNNNNPICFEIGSGSGNFAIEMATRYKNFNFLCDELRLKRLVYSARKSEKRLLNNIKFIRFDANKINEILGENELDTVFINFPDPWENEEHKRILSKNLLNTLKTVLRKNGKILFKTDHSDYYHSTLDLIANIDGYEVINHTDDLYNSDFIENNVKTEFENLFINKLKQKIKYIEIVKL